MVVTVQQTTNFFEQPDQMVIPHAMVVELQNEGIVTVDNLEEFDKDDLDQILLNF